MTRALAKGGEVADGGGALERRVLGRGRARLLKGVGQQRLCEYEGWRLY
jgi:hypothetical protein